MDVPGRLKVRMDPSDVGEVLGTLLNDARKHARSTVTVSAWPHGGDVTVAVVGYGPGIPQDERARLVRRGEQGQAATEGSGLGPAIVTGVLASNRQELQLGATGGQGCASRDGPAR